VTNDQSRMDNKVVPLLSESQILHLSTGHEGGAGLAARRLNSTLRKVGIKSSFCALNKQGFNPQEFEYALDRPRLQTLAGRGNSALHSRLSQQAFFSLRSAGFVDTVFLRNLGVTQNTILHFHNWFNLISISQLSELQSDGFRIFLTMHDERIFTGGCHYSLNCQKFTSGCKKCPAIPRILNGIPGNNLKSAAEALLNKGNPITLIAPSRWIAQEFSKSALSKIMNLQIVTNIHGQAVYEKPGAPTSEKIRIGYASKYANSWIKGYDILQQLQRAQSEMNLNLEFIFMSDFQDSESTKSLFWGSIDFLLVPSRIDNSPNVIHEARLNGIPIIASTVGGINELISEDTDIAFDVNTIKTEDLINRILSYKWNGEQKTNYENLQRKHSLEQESSLRKMVELYKINL
jgi:hypothetical protein